MMRTLDLFMTRTTPTGLARFVLHAAGFAAVTGLATTPAAAHPHVWVWNKTVVLHKDGALVGLRYTWLFDEMYSASAVEDLDKNRDGKLDRSELAELAKVNVEGIKEFEYFTTSKFRGKPIQIADPKDYFMELRELDQGPGPQLEPEPPAKAGNSAADAAKAKTPQKVKLLALEFTLPFKQTMSLPIKDFQFMVSDSSMFIWFEPVPKDPAMFAEGAPAGCRLVMAAPELSEEQKRLNDAFGGAGGLSLGSVTKRNAIVNCDK
jgi:ABC-type uncharacterized transport system substrate-binding protein